MPPGQPRVAVGQRVAGVGVELARQGLGNDVRRRVSASQVAMPSRSLRKPGRCSSATMCSLNGPRITSTSLPRLCKQADHPLEGPPLERTSRPTQSNCAGSRASPAVHGLCRGLAGPRSGSSAGSPGTVRVICASGFRQALGQPRRLAAVLFQRPVRGCSAGRNRRCPGGPPRPKKPTFRSITAPSRSAASAR